MTEESRESDDEPAWFHHSATLRILGSIADLDAITAALELSPTHTHRQGDRRHPSAKPFEQDMWSYKSPVPKDQPLDRHIQTLWSDLKPHEDFLIGLKKSLTVDVFCSYTTNCAGAGFEVSHRSLEMFTRLEIPFGVSIIA